METFRAAADLVRFLGPDLETADAARLQACRRLVGLAGWSDPGLIAGELAELRLPREPWALRRTHQDTEGPKPPEAWVQLRDAFRAVERLLPPETTLEQAVASLGADAVLIVTRCVPGGTDADAIKVARRLGLPSVTLIWGEDDLSGKAVLTEDPDRLLVWNDVQAAVAVEQHGVPPERVAVVGAAGLDRAILDVARRAGDGQPAARDDRLRATSDGGRRNLGRPPRILVVSPPALIRKVPEVFEALFEADADVIFSGKHAEKLKLPDEILAHPRASAVELPLVRTGEAADGVVVLRALADLVRFLRADLEDGTWPRIRAARRLLKLVQHPGWRTLAPQAAQLRAPPEVQARLSSAFRSIERLLPPPSSLAAAIDALDVDAVLLVTRFSLGGFEPDVIKAARQLDLPSLMLVWSWDNLSSKALLNEHPDWLLVWNDVQAAEAVDLHGVSPDRIKVVGAANFDDFFEEIRSAEQPARASVTEGAALLYLGSSPNVAPDEPQVFDRWLAALRASDDPLLRSARVRVRPHPGGLSWDSWSPPDERVELMNAPTKSDLRELSQLLVEADAVIALNTSAEIEAAIADRPVVTFRAGPEALGQEGSLHFKYLLEQEGGFAIDAGTLEEHVEKLSAVVRGDYDPAPRRDFVERFVRPGGLAHAVAPQVASAVLELAKIGTAVSV